MNGKKIGPGLLAALLCLCLAGCAAVSPAPGQSAAPPGQTAEPSPEPLTQVPEEEPTASPAPPTAFQQAQDLLDTLSLEEKVGQIFLARCPAAEAARLAAEYHLGGYVLFGRDFVGKTPQEVTDTIASYQEAAAIPMLIAVDEEGGSVNRVSSSTAFRASPFLSPRALYNFGGWAAIADDTQEKCALLRDLGINVNLAPVCDVSLNPGEYMYSRSFGLSAAETAVYADTVVQVMERNAMGSVLKHFPGYGPGGDTHEQTVHDERPYSAFEEGDFLPFIAGIEAGAGAILVSHNIVTCMDGENPASLSPEVHRILREDLGFEGVIMTDDLVMAAVSAKLDAGQAAVQAVLAGNDMLCATDFEVQSAAVLAAMEDGRIPMERLDEAVLRVLIWKIEKLGLFLP